MSSYLLLVHDHCPAVGLAYLKFLRVEIRVIINLVLDYGPVHRLLDNVKVIGDFSFVDRVPKIIGTINSTAGSEDGKEKT